MNSRTSKSKRLIILAGTLLFYFAISIFTANCNAYMFYSKIFIGQNTSDLTIQAQLQDAKVITSKIENKQTFVFYGLPFPAAECSIISENGFVVSKRFVLTFF